MAPRWKRNLLSCAGRPPHGCGCEDLAPVRDGYTSTVVSDPDESRGRALRTARTPVLGGAGRQPVPHRVRSRDGWADHAADGRSQLADCQPRNPGNRKMSPQKGIAHYRILSKLGQGGMGEVWRATDTKLNREVAVKVLPEAFAADPDRMARFTREAQVLASLNHPNIAVIYGVEE